MLEDGGAHSMSNGLIRLNWRVNPPGYVLGEDPYAAGDSPEAKLGWGHYDHRRVLPIGGLRPSTFGELRTRGSAWDDSQIWYDIGLGDKRDGSVAYIDLANMPPTPEGVLKFTNYWGLLVEPVGIEVWEYYRARVAIRETLECARGGKSDEMVWFLERELRRPIDTRVDRRYAQRAPYLFFEVSSLYQFCCLDLMNDCTRGADVTCCPGCGIYLQKRSGGRPKKHCSDACRTAAWRKRVAPAITASAGAGTVP
jgi:hypothetical protein